MNIDDDLSVSNALSNPHPLTTPTTMTYIVLRHALAAIMGRMVHHFQKVNSPSHYSEVIALDDELLRFMNSLPPHFSLEPDTSLDHKYPFIHAHRFLLVTEILYVRCNLHRPYLLRRLSRERYIRSRRACFECALMDHRIRREYLGSTSGEIRDPVASAYREFGSAMIAGIYLVLYPKGKHIEGMKSIIDTFLDGRQNTVQLDDVTRREVRIIDFLKNKFFQVSDGQGASASQVSSPPEDRPHTDAQLLLGLHRASSSAGNHDSPTASGVHQQSGSIPPNAVDFSQPVHALSPVQQLQQAETGTSGTGSPMADEESSAQNLLDQWCNVFSGGPTSTVDGMTSVGLPWATPGIADISPWMNGGPAIGDGLTVGDHDGMDWSYWENLVNQIRSGPVA